MPRVWEKCGPLGEARKSETEMLANVHARIYRVMKLKHRCHDGC